MDDPWPDDKAANGAAVGRLEFATAAAVRFAA
jgi:hypothetical protein